MSAGFLKIFGWMLHTKMTVDEVSCSCQQGFLTYWAIWYTEDVDRTKKGLFMRNVVDRPISREDTVVPRYTECVSSRSNKSLELV